MTTAMPRHVRQELAALRSQWKDWARGTHPSLHDGYCLHCPERCGRPDCEACAVTAYRAWRAAGIAAVAGDIKARYASAPRGARESP